MGQLARRNVIAGVAAGLLFAATAWGASGGFPSRPVFSWAGIRLESLPPAPIVAGNQQSTNGVGAQWKAGERPVIFAASVVVNATAQLCQAEKNLAGAASTVGSGENPHPVACSAGRSAGFDRIVILAEWPGVMGVLGVCTASMRARYGSGSLISVPAHANVTEGVVNIHASPPGADALVQAFVDYICLVRDEG